MLSQLICSSGPASPIFKIKTIFLFKMDDSNINMVKISDDGIDEEYELDDLPALVYFRYN